jgi:hypothetical protein
MPSRGGGPKGLRPPSPRAPRGAQLSVPSFAVLHPHTLRDQFGLFVVKSASRHVSTVFPSAIRTIIGSTQQRSTASSTACRAALSFALHHCVVAPPPTKTATAAAATHAAILGHRRTRYAALRCWRRSPSASVRDPARARQVSRPSAGSPPRQWSCSASPLSHDFGRADPIAHKPCLRESCGTVTASEFAARLALPARKFQRRPNHVGDIWQPTHLSGFRNLIVRISPC